MISANSIYKKFEKNGQKYENQAVNVFKGENNGKRKSVILIDEMRGRN